MPDEILGSLSFQSNHYDNGVPASRSVSCTLRSYLTPYTPQRGDVITGVSAEAIALRLFEQGRLYKNG